MMLEGDILIHGNTHICICGTKMMKAVGLHVLANSFRLFLEVSQSPVEGKREVFMF